MRTYLLEHAIAIGRPLYTAMGRFDGVHATVESGQYLVHLPKDTIPQFPNDIKIALKPRRGGFLAGGKVEVARPLFHGGGRRLSRFLGRRLVVIIIVLVHETRKLYHVGRTDTVVEMLCGGRNHIVVLAQAAHLVQASTVHGGVLWDGGSGKETG